MVDEADAVQGFLEKNLGEELEIAKQETSCGEVEEEIVTITEEKEEGEIVDQGKNISGLDEKTLRKYLPRSSKGTTKKVNETFASTTKEHFPSVSSKRKGHKKK